MRKAMVAGLVSLLSAAFVAGQADAQVFVRAPFVRVSVGPGVRVRAPFVNLYIPTGPRYYYDPGPGYYYAPPAYIGPPAYIAPPPTVVVPPVPQEAVPPQPAPAEPLPPAVDPSTPPIREPETDGKAISVDEFVRNFQPRAGSYEIAMINPVTKGSTMVRFSLPEGMPKNVEYRNNRVEFRYGPLRFVRIQFDGDGVEVTSR